MTGFFTSFSYLCEKDRKMRLRIIKNRPRFLPGGDIQDINQTSDVSSNPYTSVVGMDGMFKPAYMDEEESTIEGDLLNQHKGDFLLPNMSNNDYSNDVTPPTTMSQMDVQNVNSWAASKPVEKYTNSVDNNTAEPKKSQDGNPLEPMTIPYFAPDLAGRAKMIGRGIGAIKFGKENDSKTMKTLGGIETGLSALSFGMGAAREIMGGMSEINAQVKDEQAAREKLAKERRNQFIKYEQEGGDVNLGNGQRLDTSDMTGEYIYPLPKSMEDNANVEIEKGEYAILPDVTGPMEAKGEKHENGGTPVNLPEAHIVSDYRKITDDFATYVRDNYGIKATSKDSYAMLLDRYKKKIGLSEKYEDQKKVYERLKKNEKVKDDNTSELNKSILSKYISENQEEIDALEENFRSFADLVYRKQEESKRNEEMDDFFREGGPVDIKSVRKQAKTFGISEDKAKGWIYDEYVKQRRKMAVGGPTKERTEELRKLKDVLLKQFGRQLNMSVVDVADREKILNPDSNVNWSQGLQHKSDFGYGRLNEKARENLLDVNRWGNRFMKDGELDVEGFQTGYNKQLNDLWSLAEVGAISNADDAKQFRKNYGFWGEDSEAYDQPNDSAYESRSVDNKFGQTTATRSYYALDVVTPEQKKLLNEKGIRNYVDLFGDKAEDAKKILGSDYDKFTAIRDSGIANDMDFILGENKPQEKAPSAEYNPMPIPKEPVRKLEGMPEYNIPETKSPQTDGMDGAGATRPAGRAGSNSFGAIFPEVFRPIDSGIIVEGMERHQAPRVDPVLQSADQYINELNRATASQLDAIGDVPDSQRAAIMANMNAIAGSNIAKYIHQVNLDNARQINEADRFNETAYVQMDDKNIAERQRYEAGVLKAMAIRDENLARYYDSINSEIQSKFNVQTSLNTISSIAPNLRLLPNGTLAYVQGNEDVINTGDYSTRLLQKMNEEAEAKSKKGGSK